MESDSQRTEESLSPVRATSSAFSILLCSLYFLVVFDVFALVVFLTAGLAELPQGFLAEQPPFCAMVFTSFHKSFRLFMGTPSQKQTRDVLKQAMFIVG
jgi:hypothetical protein